jgi:hypothetical protein
MADDIARPVMWLADTEGNIATVQAFVLSAGLHKSVDRASGLVALRASCLNRATAPAIPST